MQIPSTSQLKNTPQGPIKEYRENANAQKGTIKEGKENSNSQYVKSYKITIARIEMRSTT